MRPHARAAWAPAVVAVVALAARLVPVLRGGGLGGFLAYDDGVYFGAAESFVFGRLPYRDFLLLHPPGIVVVLAPFAELARWVSDDRAFALARLVFMGVGALNAVLAFRVARRLGLAAGLAAGLFYALWAPAAYAERTTLLEPLVNLGVLASLAALGDLRTTSRRRVVAAGVALGLATAVKVWAVVPALVLVGWLVVRAGHRRAAVFLAGVAAAGGAVCLPFFLAAPQRMIRLVVADQLGRTNNGIGTVQRLAGMTDVHLTGGHATAGRARETLLLAVVVLVVAAVVAWREPLARPWTTLLAAQATVLLASPSYFSHYATYVAPTLALVAGAAAGLVVRGVRAHAPASLPLATAALAAALGLAAVGGSALARPEGRPGPGAVVARAVADARCVTGDTPEVLITSDTMTRDLQHGCAVIVDVTGLTYDQDRGDLGQGWTRRARRRDLEWQRRVARYFTGSDVAVVAAHNGDGLAASTLGRLARGEREVRMGQYLVFEH